MINSKRLDVTVQNKLIEILKNQSLYQFPKKRLFLIRKPETKMEDANDENIEMKRSRAKKRWIALKIKLQNYLHNTMITNGMGSQIKKDSLVKLYSIGVIDLDEECRK